MVFYAFIVLLLSLPNTYYIIICPECFTILLILYTKAPMFNNITKITVLITNNNDSVYLLNT